MSYNIKGISNKEFMAEHHRVYKDLEGNWLALPPITDMALQKVVNNYISVLNGN